MSAPSPVLPERRHRSPSVPVSRALSSPTRAGIYDHLKEAGEARTVRDVAELFDLHPNVARTHLELLADAGLVSVGRRKHPGGGRPAKVYTARSDVQPLDPAAEPGSEHAATALLVRLLLALAEDRSARPVGPRADAAVVGRAHDVALAEGRRLAAPGPDPAPQSLEAAVAAALQALTACAPAARVVRSGTDWVDIAGIRGMFPLIEDRPALAEAFERGLLQGALAAVGATVSLADAGEAPGGQAVLRARLVTSSQGRGAPAPATTVDARGGQREAGVVRAMRAVTSLRTGEVLEVLAEGPGSPAAFARWADRAGHELLGVERATDGTGRPAIRLLIRKGA